MPYFMVAKVVFDESVHSLKHFRVLIFNIAIRRFGIGGQGFYIHAISVPDFFCNFNIRNNIVNISMMRGRFFISSEGPEKIVLSN